MRRTVLSLVPRWVWPRTVTLDGAVIAVREAPYVFGIKRLLASGAYEAEERSLLVQTLQPGMQVLELGGSIGILAAVASHAVGAQGRVVTVEADPDLAAQTRSWLQRPGSNVTVVTGAAVPVWRAPDNLRVRGFNSSTSPLLGRVNLDFRGADVSHDVWDVRRLCAEFDLAPDVLMVDIEGSEIAMTHAPLNLPDSVRYLVIEVHPKMYPAGAEDARAVRRAITDDGFAVMQEVHSGHRGRRAKGDAADVHDRSFSLLCQRVE